MRPVPVQVEIAGPGRVVVNSPLTFLTARRVCEAGIACFRGDGSPLIIVDCAGVPQADSAGLAVLIQWRRWALAQGHHLRFANLPAAINAIARLSEVSQVLADATA